MECSETQVTLHYENMTVKQRKYHTECLLFDLGTNYFRSSTTFPLYSRLFTISAFILEVQKN